MATETKNTLNYGLVGRNISYSFSKDYFSKKFELEDKTNCTYSNFDIDDIKELKSILHQNPNIKGLNVTIPYKENVMPLLDKLHSKALKIGAVNTIKITKSGKLKGYNTDEYGFRKSLLPHLKKQHKKALILGTGGASKAIAYSLKKLNIPYQFVSRKTNGDYNYSTLTEEIIMNHQIIINCTPVGTHPKINECPNIPYQAITKNHLLYDLIYNPSETLFLRKGKAQGASICNGLDMLIKQAEKAWRIWNK